MQRIACFYVSVLPGFTALKQPVFKINIYHRFVRQDTYSGDNMLYIHGSSKGTSCGLVAVQSVICMSSPLDRYVHPTEDDVQLRICLGHWKSELQ